MFYRSEKDDEKKKKYKQRLLYFKDVRMQFLAGQKADKFSKEVQKAAISMNQVRFLPACVIKTTRNTYFAVEQFLPGKYQKFSTNFFDRSEMLLPQKKGEEILRSFTHWTYISSASKNSENEYLICDNQGTVVLNGNIRVFLLTDPQFHCGSYLKADSGGEYGLGDFGRDSINAFNEYHRCGDTCRGLMLENIDQNHQVEPVPKTYRDKCNVCLFLFVLLVVIGIPILFDSSEWSVNDVAYKSSIKEL